MFWAGGKIGGGGELGNQEEYLATDGTRNEHGFAEGDKGGAQQKLRPTGVLRTVYIRRGEFQESLFIANGSSPGKMIEGIGKGG